MGNSPYGRMESQENLDFRICTQWDWEFDFWRCLGGVEAQHSGRFYSSIVLAHIGHVQHRNTPGYFASQLNYIQELKMRKYK